MRAPSSPTTSLEFQEGNTREKKKDKINSSILTRIRVWIRWAVDVILAPYRWLFPKELFWGKQRKISLSLTANATSSTRSYFHYRTTPTRSKLNVDYVEHSPSWSRADLYGLPGIETMVDGRLSFKLSQLLAAANGHSDGLYCIRNSKSLDINNIPNDALAPYHSEQPTNQKLTLVLDLDETLIFTTTESCSYCDLITEVSQHPSIKAPPLLYYIHKRPHLDQFLTVICDWFRLAIYTASRAEYAMTVCDWLDPSGKMFGNRRLFRDSCIYQDGMYLKDLKLIEPDMGKVCLLDNSPCSFLLCPDNAIPISGWSLKLMDDRGLLELLPFLDALRFATDVRSLLSLRRLV